MKKEQNSVEVLRNYYLAIIDKTNELLSCNSEWKTQYDDYLLEPDWISGCKEKEEAMQYWVTAYDNCIKFIEETTDLVFYFSVQGTASLRFRGNIIVKIDSKSVVSSQGSNVFGTLNNTKICKEYLKEAGIEYSPSTIDISSEEYRNLFQIAFPHHDAATTMIGVTVNGITPHENSYESRILQLLDLGRKDKKVNHFYQSMRPVKRLIRHGEGPTDKNEIGFYQFKTPIAASDVHNGVENLRYSRTPLAGIDCLLRRGSRIGHRVLTLLELKDEYKPAESPELAIGQLIAYATFVCNLLSGKNGEGWGQEFGYRSGYKQSELNCIIMMPLPERGNPRTDFLEMNGKPLVLEVCTLFNTRYNLNLHYCYFDKTDISKRIITSLKPVNN